MTRVSLVIDPATCPELTLSNGMIIYNPSSTPRLNGAIATHMCNIGYQLTSSTATPTRMCQSNTEWTLTRRVCERMLTQ